MTDEKAINELTKHFYNSTYEERYQDFISNILFLPYYIANKTEYEENIINIIHCSIISMLALKQVTHNQLDEESICEYFKDHKLRFLEAIKILKENHPDDISLFIYEIELFVNNHIICNANDD